MVWVESGGPKKTAWNTRPMQIGNPSDPGYGALKKGESAAKIIVDAKLKADINKINTPTVNVRIGIAYLISRLAKIEIRSLRSDKDKKEYEYIYPWRLRFRCHCTPSLFHDCVEIPRNRTIIPRHFALP